MASPGPDSKPGQNFQEWRAPKDNYRSFDSTGSIIDSGTSVTSQPSSRSTLSSSNEVESSRGCVQSCLPVDNETSDTEIPRDQQNLSNTASDIIDGIRMIHLATPQQVHKNSSARAITDEVDADSSDSFIPEVNIPKPPSAVSLNSPAISTASAKSIRRNNNNASTSTSSSSSSGAISSDGNTVASSSSPNAVSESRSAVSPVATSSTTTIPSVDAARTGGDSAGMNDATSYVGPSGHRSTSDSPSPPRPARSSTPNSFLEDAGLMGPNPNISEVMSPAGSQLPRNCPTFVNAGPSDVNGDRSSDNTDQVVPAGFSGLSSGYARSDTSLSSSGSSGHVMERASLSSSVSSSGEQADLSSSGHTPFALKFAEYIQKYYVPAYGPVGNTSVETVVRRLQLVAISDSISDDNSAGATSHQNINPGPIVTSPPLTPGNNPSLTDGQAYAVVSVQTESFDNHSTTNSDPAPLAPAAPTSSNGHRRTPTLRTPASSGRGTSSTPNTSTPRRSPRFLSSSPSSSAAGRVANESTPASITSVIEGEGNANAEVVTPTQLNYDIVAVYPRFFQLKSGFSVPKRSFKLLCSSIMQRNHPGLRFSAASVEALQDAAEDFLVKTFENACKITGVRKSTTTAAKDIRIVLALKEPNIHKDLPPLQNIVKKYNKRKAHKPVRLFQDELNNNDMSLD